METEMTRYGYVYGGDTQLGDGTADYPVSMVRSSGVCWVEQPLSEVRLKAMMLRNIRNERPGLEDSPADVRIFWYSDLEPVPVHPE